ncbi:Site-specific recombinase XerD [Burkholderia pseudomallei]|uniref:tyrosine-type recombinase/integrase n=1 Tax=Burkholderia pseudomallei TaxID=28450 RepID=UPI00061CADC4|nr:tyrosine-type recombinase/integrase [Burkholderia pseudomallei]CPF96556.1 Site-specific recombinase XerD [Burkholderia pseudomallei]
MSMSTRAAPLQPVERAQPHKVNFATSGALAGAFKKPGRKTDVNPTSLQLRVSEKMRAVWYYRFRGPDGELIEGTLRLRAVPHDGDGKVTLDYEQAKERVAKLKLESRKTEVEKHADSNRSQFHTLADGFEYYKKHRVTKGDGPLKESTKRNYDKVFNMYLRKPILDGKRFSKPPSEWVLSDTEVMQWTELLTAIKQRSLAKARNCQAIISGVYGMGVALSVLDTNPIVNVRYLRTLPALPKKSGHVDTVNLPEFFAAIESNLSRQDSKDAVLLVTMTGTRLLAGLGMRWSQINFEDGYYYVLPDQEGWKGFSGVLPLSDFVLELLARRRSRVSSTSEYVFPAHHGEAYPHRSRMADAMKAVSAEFNFKPTAQDLRRTFATVSALCFNDNMRKVGAMLTHRWAVSAEGMVVTRDAITRRYVQSALPQLRVAANLAANFILELAGKRPMSDRTRAILKENDPENLRLLDLSAGNEERELERLALDKEREALLCGRMSADLPGEVTGA